MNLHWSICLHISCEAENPSHLSGAAWDRCLCMDSSSISWPHVKTDPNAHSLSPVSQRSRSKNKHFFFKCEKHKNILAYLSQWLQTLGSSGFRFNATVVKPRMRSHVSGTFADPILLSERETGKEKCIDERWICSLMSKKHKHLRCKPSVTNFLWDTLNHTWGQIKRGLFYG